MKLMLKIDRISAWILLICIVLYVLTGLDILRRLVAPQISSLIHLKYLFIPAQVSFAFHTAYAIYRFLKRRSIGSGIAACITAVYSAANLALLVYFSYIQFFS